MSKIHNRKLILFQGSAKIDGIQFNIIIKVEKGVYRIEGKNEHTQLQLEMEADEYFKLHNS